MSDNSNMADPSTVGLAAYGLGLFCLACVVAGIAGAAPMALIIPLTLFVGVVHLFVGAVGFKKGELFTALAFKIYGIFWLTFGIMQLGASLKWFAPPGDTIMMIFYLAFTIFTTYVFIGTLLTCTAVILTIGSLWIIFALLTLSIYLSNPALATYAGYLGIYSALNGFYVSAGGLLNTMYGRAVLPMGSAWASATPPSDQSRSV